MTPENSKTDSRSDRLRVKKTTETKARTNQVRKNIYHSTTSSTRPAVVSRSSMGRLTASRPSSRPTAREKMEVAVPFGLGEGTRVRVPSLALDLGNRWISGVIAIICLALLFVMWSVDPFIVHSAKLVGNERLGASDLNAVLGVMGKSVVLASPEQMKHNLMAAFPELKDVKVSVGFPGGVTVRVTERKPLIAWQQDSKVSWIDADGVAFPPRGAADGLIPVLALGDPPAIQSDPSYTKVNIMSKQLLTPQTVQALQSMIAYMPQGTTLIYEPDYGLGWNDSRGWKAYFGKTTGDMAVKVTMYQAIVDNLTQRGITPNMVSVEYPNAPFYRLGQ
jgi:cell division protein FtsQ